MSDKRERADSAEWEDINNHTNHLSHYLKIYQKIFVLVLDFSI
jgi:hypothetical protein